jgi:hypothetical protein
MIIADSKLIRPFRNTSVIVSEECAGSGPARTVAVGERVCHHSSKMMYTFQLLTNGCK